MKIEYAKAYEDGLVKVGVKVLTYPNHAGTCHTGIVQQIIPYDNEKPEENMLVYIDYTNPKNGNLALELCNGRYTRRFDSSLDIQYVIIDE